MAGVEIAMLWGIVALSINSMRSYCAHQLLRTNWLTEHPIVARQAMTGIAMVAAAMWVAMGLIIWFQDDPLAEAGGLLFILGPMITSSLHYRTCPGLFIVAQSVFGASLLFVAGDLFTREQASHVGIGVLVMLSYIVMTARQMVRDQRKLRRAMADAAQANRMKSAFLATMSHEIRTPLVGVLGAAEALHAQLRQPDNLRMVDTITNSADLLLTLLNDILDYSKIEAGALSLTPRPTKLAQVIELSAGTFAEQARIKGLAIDVMVEPLLAEPLMLDDLRLRQVLMNLIANGLKFTSRGGLLICAYGDEHRQTIRLTVSDSGIGIPHEVQNKLFVPFMQADSGIARRYGGTGLGLAISQRLVQMMGGSIQVVSEPGVGSTFTIELPWVRDTQPAVMACSPTASSDQLATHSAQTANGTDAATEPPPMPQPQLLSDPMVLTPIPVMPPTAVTPAIAQTQPKSALEGVAVLLAEDTPVNRKVVTSLLTSLGCKVTAVEDGEAALQAAAQQPFDIVLMDVHMPVTDGITATQRLRASVGPNHDVPVLAFTADVYGERREQCLAAGMTGFVAKPARKDALAEEIRTALPMRYRPPEPEEPADEDLLLAI